MSRGLGGLTDEEVRELFNTPLPATERVPASAYAGPWVERAKAVMQTFGKPPLAEDGEVRCMKCILPTTQMHPALNRNDRVCFWCGNDELVLSGSAIRDWYRVPAPPEPKPEEEKAGPPVPVGRVLGGKYYYASGNGIFSSALPPPQPISSTGAYTANASGYGNHQGTHTFDVDHAGVSTIVMGSGGAQCAQCVADLQAASMKQQLPQAERRLRGPLQTDLGGVPATATLVWAFAFLNAVAYASLGDASWWWLLPITWAYAGFINCGFTNPDERKPQSVSAWLNNLILTFLLWPIPAILVGSGDIQGEVWSLRRVTEV